MLLILSIKPDLCLKCFSANKDGIGLRVIIIDPFAAIHMLAIYACTSIYTSIAVYMYRPIALLNYVQII